MDIRILHLVDGAKKAEGLTVIIDVFRAFTLEAYLFAQNCEKVIAVYDKETAEQLKRVHPEYILIGERKGRILPGFDYGNSPSAIWGKDFTGKTIVHTTTNGTHGMDNALYADEILTGALVNARAIAKYIRKKNPSMVSLVCMGWEERRTEEDILCAEYIKSILEDHPIKDIKERAFNLCYTEGKKFFDQTQQDVFPEADFELCTKVDCFDFVIRTERKEKIFENHMEKMG